MARIEISLATDECSHVAPLTKLVSREQISRARTAFLSVSGMGCPTCALRVRNGFLQMDGVLSAEVVLNNGLAKVWYDPELVQLANLAPGLNTNADDARHHYTAQLLEVFDESSGGENVATR